MAVGDKSLGKLAQEIIDDIERALGEFTARLNDTIAGRILTREEFFNALKQAGGKLAFIDYEYTAVKTRDSPHRSYIEYLFRAYYEYKAGTSHGDLNIEVSMTMRVLQIYIHRFYYVIDYAIPHIDEHGILADIERQLGGSQSSH